MKKNRENQIKLIRKFLSDAPISEIAMCLFNEMCEKEKALNFIKMKGLYSEYKKPKT